MNRNEARAAWLEDRQRIADAGITVLPTIQSYIPDEFKRNFDLAQDAMAFDAQPTLTTDPNSALPMMLTTMIDPDVIKVLFAPVKAAEIIDEVRKGEWTDDTALFPVIEHTGEVTSYGDHANGGSTGVNANFPARQSYLFQTVKQYGEREIARAGLAKINFTSEIDVAAAAVINRFHNFAYFFGIYGLQNYGLLNDPNLGAALVPGPKAAGNGNVWMNGTSINATANEVMLDIQAMYAQLVAQTAGLVDQESELILAISPTSEVALQSTNSFGLGVADLIKKQLPKLQIKTAVQYGKQSTANPQGVVAGNFAQMICKNVEGQKTLFCAYNEKMRQFPIIKDMSSYKQKVASGVWGTIIRQPFAISSMVGL